MASVKVTLHTEKIRKDGTCPVRLQVIHNRKRVVKTLFTIDPKYWHNGSIKPNHPHYAHLNKRISKELNRCQDKIFELDQEGRTYTAQDIIDPFHSSSDLVDCIQEYLKKLNFRSARKYENLATKIKEFKPVTISGVDTEYIEQFHRFLLNHQSIGSSHTVQRYLKCFKTVLRDQFDKGNFKDQKVLSYKIPPGRGTKAKLTREEFAKIEDVDTAKPLERDVFCLLVYLRGIRIGDALQLKPENIVDGRLLLTEQKTGKLQDIKLIDKAKAILDKYEGQSDWYVLPLLTQVPDDPKKNKRYMKHIESKTSLINRGLKIIAAECGIKKSLSTHVARHTFASWADQSGLNSREIMKMLNHSSLSVTENYLSQLRRSDELDDAADRVWS